MIKLVKRTTLRAASPATLAERIAYISDVTHRDHENKTIHPAKNYNCPNQSAQAFLREVHRVEKNYQNGRRGKRGKRSRRLYEEVIYSSPHGANLTPLERESVETMVVNLIGRRTACRTAWHVDQSTGRADLHVFLAAKTHDYPPRVTLWADFGGSEGRHIYAEFDRLDELITTTLNRSPDRQVPLKSATLVRRERAHQAIGQKRPLHQEIADKFSSRITAGNIAAAITRLGHSVSKLTSRTISVVFRGRAKPCRYNLEDLLTDIAVDQSRHPSPSKPGPEIS
jgi:hypothetical protein